MRFREYQPVQLTISIHGELVLGQLLNIHRLCPEVDIEYCARSSLDPLYKERLLCSKKGRTATFGPLTLTEVL